MTDLPPEESSQPQGQLPPGEQPPETPVLPAAPEPGAPGAAGPPAETSEPAAPPALPAAEAGTPAEAEPRTEKARRKKPGAPAEGEVPPPLLVRAEAPAPPAEAEPAGPVGPRALSVTHIVDSLQRYPGAPLTFYTDVEVHEDVPGFTLRISVPSGFWPNAFVASSNQPWAQHEIVEEAGNAQFVVWKLKRAARAGERFGYELGGIIDPVAPATLTIQSEATLEVMGHEEAVRRALGTGTVRLSAVRVAHVAGAARRYRSEPLSLLTRVDILRAAPGFELLVEIPEGATLTGHHNLQGGAGEVPVLLLLQERRYLRWTVDRKLPAGDRLEYETRLAVDETDADRVLESRARVVVAGSEVGAAPDSAEETACVEVKAKGDYLSYLPAIYTEQDEFMGRFLMLFESFWGPIDRQITQLHHFFDPRLVPADLLPWLATWVDLALDDRWPEARRRQLIRSAVALYRTRGTRAGLVSYLELYTGVRPQIVENRASGFRLGPQTRMGPNAALGKGEAPFTFSVTMDLPPTMRGNAAERRRTIERIIESAKPAQAGYTLTLRG